MRRRILIPVAALAAVIALAVGLYLFQPWRLFTSSTVVEDIPTVATPAATPPVPSATASPDVTATPAAPRVLATGKLISHEHTSSGTAKILELPDGSRILRLENLDTSDGPDLRIWLTDAPVLEGTAGWYVFDDGAYLDLGALKANKGSQNYTIPASAVLGDYSSVSIWCARFAVSFAAAELNP
ncbi:DM13 domain-containing protein [Pseudarthrobacter sp. NPDC058362]|uniref:DM13 domain-containing protein n=1 Tax=Pseudarthrobacter sp. NPDC058362 TaxID=3346458 RepID=UPI00364E125C